MVARNVTGFFRELLLIVVAGAAVAAILVGSDRLMSKHQASRATPKPLVSTGQTLTITSRMPTESKVSLVLITSPTCPYCRKSMPFHRTLLDESGKDGIPMFVAVPSQREARDYLSELPLQDFQVKEWKDLSLGAEGTPTLVAIDERNIVRATWVGVINKSDQEVVLQFLRQKSLPSASDTSIMNTSNYAEKDLATLDRTIGPFTILDVHERDYLEHRTNSKIIPLQEIPYRAAHELKNDKTQLVSCSDIAPDQCQRAVSELLSAGFKVATLDAGIYRLSCKAQHVAE